MATESPPLGLNIEVKNEFDFFRERERERDCKHIPYI